MNITLPELSLVVIVGASGSGKSSFASKHFKQTEIVSSDYCRGLVCNNENDQTATKDAFDLLEYITAKRLRRGHLTIVDATNVRSEDRRIYVKLAREFHFLPVAIVLNTSETICKERNAKRSDRTFASHVVRNQSREVKRSIKRLKKEGFRYVYVLDSEEQINQVEIHRQPMWADKKNEYGPFDIIGDIHGCFDELKRLIIKLGYEITHSIDSVSNELVYSVLSPTGRRVIFVGDIVDRGPKSNECLRMVMDMVASGVALCVPGNHEAKLYKKLIGKNVKLTHGLAETVSQLELESNAFKERIQQFIDGLVSHLVLDDGKLVVAHAGMKEAYQGRGSGKIKAFALFGETTGATDELGFPVRYDWAQEYRGKALVVYGHTPVPSAVFINNTICIDTGCVFGGSLTALRYPEKELVNVTAAQTYYEPVKPLDVQDEAIDNDLLDINDLLGRHHISTQFGPTIIIREGNTLAAIESMSRFSVNPRWLIYVPPTMSPPDASKLESYLEHPAEAFSYYKKQAVKRVICEEKHMGSRCIIHICRDKTVVERVFGIVGTDIGICYSRTGRRFFTDTALESALLRSFCDVLNEAKFWERFNTEWASFDCELMPWSLKAKDLIRHQYAAVGSSASNSLSAVVTALTMTKQRGVEISSLLENYEIRNADTEKFKQAYRPYCWEVNSFDDLKLSPFQLLATQGQIHTDKSHDWHMNEIAALANVAGNWLHPTHYKIVDLHDPGSEQEAIQWWEEMTQSGGEGMVVKPIEGIVQTSKGLVQPAIKCRGASYLRIIYGMDYDRSNNLIQLRNRNLSLKRRMALREFMLGIEGLTRFVEKHSFQHIHECALGVLALESEPVDPRL